MEQRPSINYPIVILDGKAFGFKIRSGVIPVFVYGKSSEGIIAPHVDFCPC